MPSTQITLFIGPGRNIPNYRDCRHASSTETHRINKLARRWMRDRCKHGMMPTLLRPPTGLKVFEKFMKTLQSSGTPRSHSEINETEGLSCAEGFSTRHNSRVCPPVASIQPHQYQLL